MATDLQLGVDVTQVQKGKQSLDDLRASAQAAARSAEELWTAQTKQMNGAKQAAQAIQDEQKQLSSLLNAINPLNKAFAQLDQKQAGLSKAMKSGSVPLDVYNEYNEILETQRTRLQGVQDALTAEGRAAQEEARAKAQADKAADSFIAGLQRQTAVLGKSATEILELKAAQMGLTEQAAPYISALREQEAAQARDAAQKQAAAIAARGLRQAIAEMDKEQRAAAAATERHQKSQQSFISTLENEINSIGKTRSELLQLKAAQLGVSDQAAPFIARIREQEGAFRQGGISAGQYKQALRLLPAQFTDIATSIAGGMPLWMVLIQQGGQITDSFGGISGTFEALKAAFSGFNEPAQETSESLGDAAGSLNDVADAGEKVTRFITPARLAFGGLAAVVAAGAFAFVKYQNSIDQINTALIRTGNLAGTSAQAVISSANSIADATDASATDVRSLMAALINTGALTEEQINKAALATAKAADVGILSSEEIVAAYSAIAKNPVEGLQRLNSAYNFLTLEQLKHIDNLVKEKKYTEANAQAMDLFSAAAKKMGEDAYDSLSPFAKLWQDLGGWATDTMDSIGSAVSTLAANTLKEFNAIYYGVAIAFNKLNQVVAGSIVAAIEAIPEWARPDKLNDFANANRELAAGNETQIQNLQKAWDDSNKEAEKYLGTQKKITQGATLTDRQEVAAYNPKEKARKEKGPVSSIEKGDSQLTQARAQLLVLQQQTQSLRIQDGQVVSINDGQKKILELEQLINSYKGQTLNKQQQSVVANAQELKSVYEQIDAQQTLLRQRQAQLNLQLQFQNANQSIDDEIAAQRQSVGLSSQQQAMVQKEISLQRQLSTVYGEGWRENTEAAGLYQQQMAKLNEQQAVQAETQNDLLGGISTGYHDWVDQVTNLAVIGSQIVQSVANEAVTALSGALDGSKSSFSDFFSSILQMIEKVILQLLIAQAIQAAMGWISGSVSAGSASASSGTGAMGLSTSYSGYDSGGYTGDGGKLQPAGVVHRGEFVMTKEATSRIGVDNLYSMMRGYATGGLVGGGTQTSTGSGGLTVNANTTVNMEGQSSSDQQDNGSIGKAVEQVVAKYVQEGIQKETRTGGIIYKAMRGYS